MRVVLILCCITAALAQPYCSTYYAPRGLGDACDASKNCKVPFVCNTTLGKCVQIEKGQQCSSYLDCGGLFGYCLGGKCDYMRVPGDPCTLNEQCFSNACVNSKCKALDNGAACDGSDCKVGYYCNNARNGTCVPDLSIGDSTCQQALIAVVSGWPRSAFDYFSLCGNGLCNNNGKCVEYFSQPAGAQCLDDQACLPGLACSSGYSCVQSAGATGCNATTYCDFGYDCVCDSASPPVGKCTMDPCATSFIAMEKCLIKAGCTALALNDALFGTPNTCGGKCHTEAAAYTCCWRKNSVDFIPSLKLDCTSTASTMQIASIFTVFILLNFFLAF